MSLKITLRELFYGIYNVYEAQDKYSVTRLLKKFNNDYNSVSFYPKISFPLAVLSCISYGLFLLFPLRERERNR